MDSLKDAFFKSFGPRMTVRLSPLLEASKGERKEVFELCRSALGCKYTILADTDTGVIYIGEKLK